MRNRRLERLRHARVVCNKNIAKLESQLAYQRSRREAIEVEMQAIAPDLQLPAPRRKPNTLFARGELPRMALTVLREAGEPLAVSVIARRVLQAKGDRPAPDLAAAHDARPDTGVLLCGWQARTGADGRGGEQGEAGVGLRPFVVANVSLFTFSSIQWIAYPLRLNGSIPI
jgi:hypothetical protein